MSRTIRYRNAIKSLRLLKKLRQRDLAERAGCVQADISKYEHGRTVPDLLMAMKIATALGAPVERVFYDVSDVAVAEVGENILGAQSPPA